MADNLHEDPVIIENSKEQIVAPINRKDVKKIAIEVLEDLGDDVINQAIADGKIVIPPGGTKLYLHQLLCSNQAGTSNYTFYCYSNTNKKFSENTGNFYCIGGIIQPGDEVKYAKFSYTINIGLGPNNVHYFTSDNMGVIIVVNDNITEL